MNILNQPSHPGPADHRPDDLDGLLRTFFRAEMPHPWPQMKPPAEQAPRVKPARRSPRYARWALAASVGLLLVGQVFLSGMFGESFTPGTDASFRDSEANRRSQPKVKVEKEADKDGKSAPKA